MCIFKVIIGLTLVIGGIIAEIAWLGLLFGTVIVGVVLLIFAPGVLFIPWNIGFVGGLLLMSSCGEES